MKKKKSTVAATMMKMKKKTELEVAYNCTAALVKKLRRGEEEH